MGGQEDATGWFASDRTTSFLDRVRALAPVRLGHLIEPGHTWETEYAGCLLMVNLPGVPDGGLRGTNNHLQVAWEDGVLGATGVTSTSGMGSTNGTTRRSSFAV